MKMIPISINNRLRGVVTQFDPSEDLPNFLATFYMKQLPNKSYFFWTFEKAKNWIVKNYIEKGVDS